MVTVLINAYACAPYRGSEPGMAWNWIIHLAKHCHLHVITEGEWQAEIEHALRDLPQGRNITFYYNPVPIRVREMCWNQGDWRFYYYYQKWQKSTYEIACEIIKNHKVDVLHQLNMIGFREPGYLWRIENIPFVWGPIGGLKKFPEAYLQRANFKVRIFNKLKNRLNIFQLKYSHRVRLALKRADLLISSIPDSYNAIKRVHGLESIIESETGCYVDGEQDLPHTNILDPNYFNILWVGKFDFRKQLSIAIRTISALNDRSFVKLHIVGTGNVQQQFALKEQITKHGIEENVVLHGAIPNSEVFSLMQSSQLFFFTSVSEDTSTVVLEALSYNLPILCFDTCGFGPIIDNTVGRKIQLSSPDESVMQFANEITFLYSNPSILNDMKQRCASKRLSLNWDVKAQRMVTYYQRVLGY